MYRPERRLPKLVGFDLHVIVVVTAADLEVLIVAVSSHENDRISTTDGSILV